MLEDALSRVKGTSFLGCGVLVARNRCLHHHATLLALGTVQEVVLMLLKESYRHMADGTTTGKLLQPQLSRLLPIVRLGAGQLTLRALGNFGLELRVHHANHIWKYIRRGVGVVNILNIGLLFRGATCCRSQHLNRANKAKYIESPGCAFLELMIRRTLSLYLLSSKRRKSLLYLFPCLPSLDKGFNGRTDVVLTGSYLFGAIPLP